MKICPRLNTFQISELKKRRDDTEDVHEYKKVQAILLLDECEPSQKITLLTGLKRSRVFGLRKNYLRVGLKAIESRKRRVFQLLTGKQLTEVSDVLMGKTPYDFEYNSPFWTTSILADLIWRTYKVRYKSKTSYYLIFKRTRFTFHKPGRVYEKRNEIEVKKWKGWIKPIIKKYWKDPNCVILTADEMLLSTQTTFQKIWLPQGEFPKVEVSNTRKNISIYGFLNIKTGKEHAFSAKKQTMYETVRVLQKIRQIYPRKDNRKNKLKAKRLVIIWDNPGWHKGSKVTEYVKKDGEIKILYFPPYSPEENPQEHVWKEGRNKVTNNKFISNLDRTVKDFVSYLNDHYFTYKFLNLSPL